MIIEDEVASEGVKEGVSVCEEEEDVVVLTEVDIGGFSGRGRGGGTQQGTERGRGRKRRKKKKQ